MANKTVTRLLLGLYLVFFLLGTTGSATAEATLSLEDCIEGIRIRSQLLQNIRVAMNQTIYNVGSLEERHEPSRRALLSRASYKVCRKKDKLHVRHIYRDKASGKIQSWNVYAWDGERLRGYSEFPHLERDPTGGIVSAERGPGFSAGYFLTALEDRVCGYNKPLVSLIDPATWRVTGTEKIGQYSAIVVEGPVGRGESIKLWIDPARDFAFVRMQVSKRPGTPTEVTYEVLDVKLTRRNGVWVMAHCTIFLRNLAVGGTLWQGFEYDMTEVNPGINIEDDLFVLTFPPGKTVYDKISRLVFEVKSDGTLEPVFFHGGNRESNIPLDSEDVLDGLENTESGVVSATNADGKVSADEGKARHDESIKESSLDKPVAASLGWVYILFGLGLFIVFCVYLCRRGRRAGP